MKEICKSSGKFFNFAVQSLIYCQYIIIFKNMYTLIFACLHNDVQECRSGERRNVVMFLTFFINLFK